MPIYEYRCDSCGFQKEFIQRMSDAPLTDCPACNKPTFSKMVTAAGFQLKGGGWYVTDFKGGNASGKKSGDKASESGAKESKSESSGGEAAKSDKPKGESASASPASTPSTPSSAS
ncbi:MAG: zinc ribbon domain-containing protein [Betaproteobacteria bacterium]|nr:zinc ribbon domain-containing protein [Betaproteobacteria bacterium]